MDPTARQEKEILDIFLGSLVVPKEKSKKQIIVAPVGLIGSGKTTILYKLAQRIPLVVMSGDVIRKALGERNLSFLAVYSIGEKAARKLLADGHSLAIDSDCVREDVIAMLQLQSKEYDAEILWVHINTSHEQCIENIYKRGATIFGVEPKDMIETYKMRKEKFHEKGFERNFTCTFTGNQDKTEGEIKECAENILNMLN